MIHDRAAILLAEQILQDHEGLALTPYYCTSGKLSIGYGRNLEARGLAPEEASFLLYNDVTRAADDLARNHWWEALSVARKAALIDLWHCVGAEGFRKFRKMIAAIMLGNFDMAADEIMDSKFARQTGTRANDLAAMMRGGR